ncbi:right-handed parallel beta-helix repeat-containing protein [Ciceribacter sp. L1K22]|uniref:right-handed parallel beta-helix repeat-containing protein n=1 Tax=Ciceribacter sp. L1K22 TaxID=2820275 RepID=UPI001ABDD755|nr:right-handed parallel beta-helix repeat-containing protein [Ciceribacter sp. L1K22]MBO3758738.1 right-handed parallel beta-helix repeat-containing protein [Ciceribacter sp. L1K22]
MKTLTAPSTLPLMLLACAAAIASYVGFPTDAKAEACDAAFYDKLRSPPKGKDDRVVVKCDIKLKPEDVITRKLVFAGEAASGLTLDCRGATLGSTKLKYGGSAPTLLVRSQKLKDGSGWSVPRDITIRNCKIIGNVRLTGLGPNGEAEEVRKSSLKRNHTANAQSNAPTGIVLDRITLTSTGGIPLYFGPGVTRSSVLDSTFRGKSSKTAIYLDAESAENVISGNRFAMKVGREMIAIDGSARNVISGNTFENPEKGGVFVYRNCGEGGTIRHQEPRNNRIVDNRFIYKSSIIAYPAIWLNQRDVGKWYCEPNPKYPFGSSLDPRDRAIDNVVGGNSFEGALSPMVVNTERK